MCLSWSVHLWFAAVFVFASVSGREGAPTCITWGHSHRASAEARSGPCHPKGAWMA